MNKTSSYQSPEGEIEDRDLLALNDANDLRKSTDPLVHQLKEGIICTTDRRAEPSSPLRIVVDATEGFIPLWDENLVLRWRFDRASLSVFRRPELIKARIRELLTAAIVAWGDAVPIRFVENPDNSDF